MNFGMAIVSKSTFKMGKNKVESLGRRDFHGNLPHSGLSTTNTDTVKRLWGGFNLPKSQSCPSSHSFSSKKDKMAWNGLQNSPNNFTSQTIISNYYANTIVKKLWEFCFIFVFQSVQLL